MSNSSKGTMMKHLLVLLFLITGTLSLYGSNDDLSISKGTNQDVIVHLTPVPLQTDVWNNAKIEATFDVSLDTSAIQEHNVKLTHMSSKTNDHTIGTISYSETAKTLTFTPSSLLAEGMYEVEIKSLKADKAYKTTQIEEIKYRFYVPEVINGYQLPPEPDKQLNNSTLLGIDTNDNGIRDDIERNIIIDYVKPIEIELMLSYVKVHQEMLNNPVNSAVYSQKKMQKVRNCKMYLKHQDIRISNMIDFTENNMYNTKERVKAYLDFNQALSGGVYGSGPSDWNALSCDFDIEKMLKDRK